MNPQLCHADQYIELNLRECGREKCIPDKVFSFTVKNYHLFHYVVAGEGFLEMAGQKYALKKGHIFYVPPGVQPLYYPSKEDPWTYIWLGFNGSSSGKFLSESGITKDTPIVKDRNDLVLKGLFEDIFERYQTSGFLDLKCLGLAYQIFDALLCMSPKRSEAPLNSKQRLINETKDFVANNYQFAITIDDIASSVGVTPNYLANIFASELSTSPKRYLTDFRMEKACLLLKTQGYKVKEIGLLVGYKNQLHFSSEFKKNLGVSPLEYRRRQGNLEEDE